MDYCGKLYTEAKYGTGKRSAGRSLATWGWVIDGVYEPAYTPGNARVCGYKVTVSGENWVLVCVDCARRVGLIW